MNLNDRDGEMMRTSRGLAGAVVVVAAAAGGCGTTASPVSPSPHLVESTRALARGDVRLCREVPTVAAFARATHVRSSDPAVLARRYASIYERSTGLGQLVQAGCYRALVGKPAR